MEDPTESRELERTKKVKGIPESLPYMQYHGEPKLVCPAKLPLEGLELFASEGRIPIVVESDLTDSYDTLSEVLLQIGELCLVVLLDIGRVEANSREETLGISLTERLDQCPTLTVDTGEDHLRHARLFGSLKHR